MSVVTTHAMSGKIRNCHYCPSGGRTGENRNRRTSVLLDSHLRGNDGIRLINFSYNRFGGMEFVRNQVSIKG